MNSDLEIGSASSSPAVPLYSNRQFAVNSLHSSFLGKSSALPVEISLEHVNYFVNNGKKQIIHDVSLKFLPGRLACLMGPSGSGKTTIVNVFMGNASGTIKGNVLINGEPGPTRHFKKIAKLIPQEDVLLSSLTVGETLSFHSELVLPQNTTKEKRLNRVNEIISLLGLTTCMDTSIGSGESKGISGGQRKRVSISLELLSNPGVLCLDEPTSGLDSSSAEDVAQILQVLARDSHRTVVTIIHQPSYRIFSMFDDVTFLTCGRVAYSGPMKDVESFFGSLGHHVPSKENPADHFMRLLQDPDLQDSLPVAFKQQAVKYVQPTRYLSSLENSSSLKDLPSYPTSQLHQIHVLFRRHLLDYVKDPAKFLRMMFVRFLIGVLVGGVWFQKANPPRQAELRAIEGALFILVSTGSINTIIQTILTFPSVRLLLLREFKNGTYSAFAFYIAIIMVLAVTGIFFSALNALPLYFMIGFEYSIEKFGPLFLSVCATTLLSNALAVGIGAASKDIMEAQAFIVPVISPLMLFSGYLIPQKQLPSWAVPFYYMSFFQYGIVFAELNCFTGMVFEDFSLDILHPAKIRPFKTGEQFLEAIGLDPETHKAYTYMAILWGYAATVTLLAFFLVLRAVNKKTG